ncbi:hypothetical protein [Flexithrix dorotheae]|uniref:hypothetical protein n=1 Tax=Flexithrix dorotheae TaxID=70993 RepID=UPI000379EEB6|nr:hypothetical protein [Flexithrix dorotheae]
MSNIDIELKVIKKIDSFFSFTWSYSRQVNQIYHPRLQGGWPSQAFKTLFWLTGDTTAILEPCLAERNEEEDFNLTAMSLASSIEG